MLFQSSHHGSADTNLTGIHEVIGLIPGLAQWVKELWCRSQMWLGSGIVMAVAQASSYSTDLIPSLATSICHGAALKRLCCS